MCLEQDPELVTYLFLRASVDESQRQMFHYMSNPPPRAISCSMVNLLADGVRFTLADRRPLQGDGL
jgi:hypothetical protein